MFTARYVLHSAFCPHSVFMCFVWIWEQTAIISLYSIDWLVFVTETECVYCAVRTGSLNTIRYKCNAIPVTICLQFNIRTLFVVMAQYSRLTFRYRRFGRFCALYLQKGCHFFSEYLPKRLQVLGKPVNVMNLHVNFSFYAFREGKIRCGSWSVDRNVAPPTRSILL